MVKAPESYRWSSFRANALGERNPLLARYELYTGLGNGSTERLAAYRALFGSRLGDDLLHAIRNALNHNKPVGNPDFLHRVEKLTEVRCDILLPGGPCARDN